MSARYEIEGCDNSHDWRAPLGLDVATKVCRACLVQETSPLAEQPCDRAHSDTTKDSNDER